jgi:hypothetical protein
LLRDGTKAAANVNFEPALLFAVFETRYCNAAHVVHIREGAGFFLTPGKRDFELSTETLGIGMSEHEFR